MASVFDVIGKEISDVKASREAALLKGAVDDYAKYRDQCGVIQGLTIALRVVEDLAKQQRNYDDD